MYTHAMPCIQKYNVLNLTTAMQCNAYTCMHAYIRHDWRLSCCIMQNVHLLHVVDNRLFIIRFFLLKKNFIFIFTVYGFTQYLQTRLVVLVPYTEMHVHTLHTIKLFFAVRLLYLSHNLDMHAVHFELKWKYINLIYFILHLYTQSRKKNK